MYYFIKSSHGGEYLRMKKNLKDIDLDNSVLEVSQSWKATHRKVYQSFFILGCCLLCNQGSEWARMHWNNISLEQHSITLRISLKLVF